MPITRLLASFLLATALTAIAWPASAERPNHAPRARDDVYSMSSSGPVLLIDPPGVLANDRDSDRDAIRVNAVVTPFAHGYFTLQPSGEVTYAPFTFGFTGDDTLTYNVIDSRGAVSRVARVTVHVLP